MQIGAKFSTPNGGVHSAWRRTRSRSCGVITWFYRPAISSGESVFSSFQSGDAVTEASAGLELKAQQVLNQVMLLAVIKTKVHALVVVVDYGIQISEASVVIEAAGEVGRERADG